MKFWVRAALLVALLASGCAGGDTIVAVNNPPTISFTFVPLGVPASIPVNLTVSVADEDGDALTVTWQITAGVLTPKNAARTTMEWDVPAQLGAYSVTVTVSDGEETKSVTHEVKVGTLVRENALTDYVLSESPYILRPDNVPPRLLVEDGFFATIHAGVEILVDLQTTTIDVTGILDVAGTEAQPVVIRPNDRGQLCQTNRSWWDGILAGGTSGEVTLAHAQVWNAKNGVRIRDSGRVTVDSSLFNCCGNNALLMEGAGRLVVTDTEISNTQVNGITVSGLTLLPELVSITGCNININENTGVSLDINDFDQEVPITITGNRFEFNFAHGIMMKNWVWPTIHNNSFASNGPLGVSNIRLLSPFHDTSSPDSIDVSCNFWGAAVASQTTIEGTIYDRLDTAGLGTRLLVAPWLNSDPYQAGSPPPCDGGSNR
jgi:hypothetical protein